MKTLLVLLIVSMMISLNPQSRKTKDEVNKKPLKEINLYSKEDGKYIGKSKLHKCKYEVEVYIKSNKIDTIKVVKSSDGTEEYNNELVNMVIKQQSIQVDAISGATTLSEAFLKAVSNALK